MRASVLAALLFTVGCADLPEGWEDAEPIPDFYQRQCAGGDPYEDYDERVEASATADAVSVDYLEAHFRCAQDVEGFYKRSGDQVDVLVQPVDMNPSQVAGCDCLYDINMTLPVEPPSTVTVYRRWDNLNSPNDPVKIATVEASSSGADTGG